VAAHSESDDGGALSEGPVYDNHFTATILFRRQLISRTVKLRLAMRKLLYSKWFFLILAAVCTIDLLADLGEQIWGRTFLSAVAIVGDSVALSLSAWIFTDLHMRRPRDGNNTGRR
jgi:hypothetical protein